MDFLQKSNKYLEIISIFSSVTHLLPYLSNNVNPWPCKSVSTPCHELWIKSACLLLIGGCLGAASFWTPLCKVLRGWMALLLQHPILFASLSCCVWNQKMFWWEKLMSEIIWIPIYLFSTKANNTVSMIHAHDPAKVQLVSLRVFYFHSTWCGLRADSTLELQLSLQKNWIEFYLYPSVESTLNSIQFFIQDWVESAFRLQQVTKLNQNNLSKLTQRHS